MQPTFNRVVKELKERFEAETGYSEPPSPSIGDDCETSMNYSACYAFWLEIQIAKGKNAKDIPSPIMKEEE